MVARQKAPAPATGTDAASIAFVTRHEEVVVGKTTQAWVLEELGQPSVDQMDGPRRFLFYVHSQSEDGRVVTRMLSIWFRADGVVDEVKYSQT